MFVMAGLDPAIHDFMPHQNCHKEGIIVAIYTQNGYTFANS